MNPRSLEQAVRRSLATQAFQGICLAYSGGLDSRVLLQLVVESGRRLSLPPIRALHVHHGLHPEADAWAAHCRATCAALNIPCQVVKVSAAARPGESPEAAAREARRAAFRARLQTGEALLLAQHGDDQAETLMLQLLRGAGPSGLAAMPARARLGQGWALRPLLEFGRDELLAFANARGLDWVEDHSNQDTRFERNYLRQVIFPQLRARWPGLRRVLVRVARHQAAASTLLAELGHEDWRACQAPAPALPAKLFPGHPPLSLDALQGVSPLRRENLLRAWLRAQGLPPPSTDKLEQLMEQMPGAGGDRQPLVAWAGAEIRRHRRLMFALPPLPAPNKTDLAWQPPASLGLPLGQLTARPRLGDGLRAPEFGQYRVRFRQGGESCRLRGQTREVKKLLQQADIPAWLREYPPLIYLDDRLAAIPGLALICDDFRAGPGETGWVLEWREHED